MIVFVSDPNLIPAIVNFTETEGNFVLLNFTSLYSGIAPDNVYPLVNHMYQINQSGMPSGQFVETFEFDLAYANSIMSAPDMYEAFMKIMFNSHEGRLVILLVSRDAYRDALMESLIKFIQQRYGYGCWIVNDPEDIPQLHEPQYTPDGLLTLESDIQDYRMQVQMGRAGYDPGNYCREY